MKRNYDDALRLLFTAGNLEDINAYLCLYSNLPGPRGNLELVESFFRVQSSTDHPLSFDQLLVLLNQPSNDNDPLTMACGSALVALSNSIYTHPEECALRLCQAMSDHRWRMRELVTEAYKKIGLSDYSLLKELFEIIGKNADGFQHRAIIATLAHPELLKLKEQQDFSLDKAHQALTYYDKNQADLFLGKDVLEKGLSFAVSVIVASQPEAGFKMIDEFTHRSPKMDRILLENLKKNRLVKKYPEQVNSAIERINQK